METFILPVSLWFCLLSFHFILQDSLQRSVHFSSIFFFLFFKLSNFHCPVFEFMDFLLSAEICSGNILCLFHLSVRWHEDMTMWNCGGDHPWLNFQKHLFRSYMLLSLCCPLSWNHMFSFDKCRLIFTLVSITKWDFRQGALLRLHLSHESFRMESSSLLAKIWGFWLVPGYHLWYCYLQWFVAPSLTPPATRPEAQLPAASLLEHLLACALISGLPLLGYDPKVWQPGTTVDRLLWVLCLKSWAMLQK